jgi:TolB-like protein/Tfp pilus assembly protein PilF
MIRADGIVKVLDFGLAKLTETSQNAIDSEAETRAKVQTNPGTVMGTVAYMSPEQARGKQIDARSDIWSLGVVLYEMIAGQVPFAGETPSHTIVSILERESAPLTKFSKNVPAELERIVRKTLRKEHNERYQTARDLMIDLKALRRELDLHSELERSLAPTGDVSNAVSTSETVPTQILAKENLTESVGGGVSTKDAIHQTSSAEYIATEIKQHKRGFALGLITLLLAAIGLGVWFFTNRTSNATQIESIAVMPFVNEGGNVDAEYLSDGMTESLINSLSQLPKLSVKARSSVFHYKGKNVSPQAIGNELSVQAVLNGRVVQRGDNLILSLELVDAQTGNQIWGEQYNRKMTELVSLQSEIARDVSNKLRAKLTGEQKQQVAKNYTENTEAYQLYLQGRFYWNKRTGEGAKKAFEYFQKAIDKDPNYALAYIGLAETHILSDFPDRYVKANALALKALEIDPTLGEAHNVLAQIKESGEWNFAEAEKEYKRAIELSPNYATAYHWYAEFLAEMGRFDESFAMYKRALELDPLSFAISTDLGMAYYYARQYDRAIEHLKKLVELDPNYVRTHEYLAMVYQEKGMFEEAIAEIEKLNALRGEDMQEFTRDKAKVEDALRKSGAKGFWQQLLDFNKEEMKKGNPVYPVDMAMLYTRLGERDEAFRWLEKAYEERSVPLTRLKVSPEWDNLRDDPRFADLIRRVGLP